MMNGRRPEGYGGGGGGLWLPLLSYGLECERGEQGGGEDDPMVKEKTNSPHFMMIFLHHCHLLLHRLFLLVLPPFCVCGCVMKATGSTVACIIWSKRTSQHRCTTAAA